MDEFEDENLAEHLKRTDKPMTEQELRDILPQILDALKSIHEAGIWHLDLKPANIMIDKAGIVKLIDFGASKQLNAQKGGATTSTAISYTNGYAPREQMEQNYEKFGPWTDIYALGATLYTLLTNKRPPLPTDIDDDISEDKHNALLFPNGISNDMRNMILSFMNTSYKLRPQHICDININPTGKKSIGKKVLFLCATLILLLGGSYCFIKPSTNIPEETDTLNIIIQGIKNNMIFVEGGSFQMGATYEQGADAYKTEKPVRKVTLNDFYISKYEVTQQEWEAIMHSNPSNNIGITNPVEMISWEECE